jgi:hypothetical protein
MVMTMKTVDITITLPTELALGRNGQIGTLTVEWDKMPRHILNHIGTVYFPQMITDKANNGGKGTPMADRLAAATAKRDALMRGDLRIRAAGKVPADPIDAIVYDRATEAVLGMVRQLPAYAAAKGKDRVGRVLAALGTDMDSLVTEMVAANPEWHDEAVEQHTRKRAGVDAAKAMIAKLVKKAA